MKATSHLMTAVLSAFFLLGAVPAHAGQAAATAHKNRTGRLEIESNIAGVELSLCPRDRFSLKTTRALFGLLKKTEENCSSGKFLLGTTPFVPVPVPAGSYVLLIPPDYAREQKQPIEIGIDPGEKTFLMLKLFKRHSAQTGGGPEGNAGSVGAGSGGGAGSSGGGSSGGGASGSGGGSGSGGAVGAGPPP